MPNSSGETLDFFFQFFQQYLVETTVAVTVLVLSAIVVIFRHKIERWLFARKIKPVFDPIMAAYREEILPEYVEKTPEIRVVLRKEDIPSGDLFGYIFVSAGQEELASTIFVTSIPVNSSLRRIRVLFDEDLRRALFDFLSYRLALECGKEDLAVKFRDRGLRMDPEDFQIIEKLYDDGKLTGILLNEAYSRLQRERGKPTTSTIIEFSKLARKMSELDVAIVRIGDGSISSYIQGIKEKRGGAILLARGHYIEKAAVIAEKLRDDSFELYSPSKIGFPNPEIGTWHFLFPEEKTVPLMRIWLKRKNHS